MAFKVLVVDDSTMFQRQLSKVVNDDPDLEVIGVATNGQEAVDLAARLKPDAITMDVNMPVLDGISAVRQIMRDNPIPVLMLSSLTTEGATMTFDALEAGATDFLPKDARFITAPANDSDGLLAKLKVIAQLDIKKKASAVKPTITPAVRVTSSAPSRGTAQDGTELIVIGSSTGGPMATHNIITKLPATISVPIVVVQHMPANFTNQYAARLNAASQLQVVEAKDGDSLKAGTVYVAPGGKQIGFKKIRRESVISIYDSAKNSTDPYSPSVTETLESCAEIFPTSTLAIILTGMGSDGCIGAKSLKKRGSKIWAQNQESCVVFGMPQAVINAGITDKVLDITEFSNHLIAEYN